MTAPAKPQRRWWWVGLFVLLGVGVFLLVFPNVQFRACGGGFGFSNGARCAAVRSTAKAYAKRVYIKAFELAINSSNLAVVQQHRDCLKLERLPTNLGDHEKIIACTLETSDDGFRVKLLLKDGRAFTLLNDGGFQ